MSTDEIDAAAHYESSAPGLANRFLREVDRCIQYILQNPESGQIVLEPVRRRLVPRFPYGVLYSLEPRLALQSASLCHRMTPACEDRRSSPPF